MMPLGRVAGTAAAVFGCMQTVGGALLGTLIGQQFDGTVTPIALGYLAMGVLALGAVIYAENGRLFRPETAAGN
jgi:DHA1 family bicyclomycin/chloramphenicol resistance-like MFS transporter